MTRHAMTWTVTGTVIACLAGGQVEAPDTVRAFRLEAPDTMPYLRTALAGRWQQQARAVFLPDSSRQVPTLPRLAYTVEEAGVAYDRAGRGRLRRTVALALRYTLTAADGRLLREEYCRDTFSDTLQRSDRAAVESEAFPETQAGVPRGGWMRRYLEPALLATATAVTVYLFFNLRSERVAE